MLLNRKIAWLITTLVMIVGLFVGNYASYHQMRAPIIEEFRSEVGPIINEKIQLVYNMLTLYRLNAPENDETRDFIMGVVRNIEIMQAEIELVRNIYAASLMIDQDIAELYRRGQALEFDENNSTIMRNLYTDIQEIKMILSQSDYNDMALAFNITVLEGLGFLTHNSVTERIFRNYGMLPIFFY